MLRAIMVTRSLSGSLIGLSVTFALAACQPQGPTGVVYAQPPTTTVDSAQPHTGVPAGPPGAGALVRVIHASPDTMASNVVIYLDNSPAPSIPNIAYRQAVGYQAAAAGSHLVQARLPGFAADSPPVLSWNTPAFAAGRAYTVVAYGLASELAGPPVAFAAVEDLNEAPAANVAQMRFFHALVGAPTVDLCTTGTMVFQGVRYGTWGMGQLGRYVQGPPGTAVFAARQSGGAPCAGQPLGTVQLTFAPGSNSTLIAVGRIAPGRGGVTPELLHCTDTPLGGPSRCTPYPLR